ncbi:NADPH:quinone reductase [Azoarcus sp. DD4]|uniref:NAD(P)H-dependent oxidoreductase n=1 Tax=Azoarcus sp. DD4 TaxID=2027405 RepID=UPI0011289BC0|nr:NAD(P)H-dependent oxidoreductase [Azoarcus sp. DD4]QDF96681.1 NADPH:quinone reductase [Azoarcus sp. DD4]
MGKRILVILGHPSHESLCGALTDAYAEAAQAAGHEVTLLRLGELDFDPSLHEGYNRIQALEADLVKVQAAIRWAEHIAFVFPVWWGSVPAVLKGMLDRVFLPGFAFQYRTGALFPEPLLKGRSADLVVSMDTPPWYFRWIYRMPAVHQMRKTTLEFCGIRPVRTLLLGPVKGAAPQRREAWLAKARALAGRIR